MPQLKNIIRGTSRFFLKKLQTSKRLKPPTLAAGGFWSSFRAWRARLN